MKIEMEFRLALSLEELQVVLQVRSPEPPFSPQRLTLEVSSEGALAPAPASKLARRALDLSASLRTIRASRRFYATMTWRKIFLHQVMIKWWRHLYFRLSLFMKYACACVERVPSAFKLSFLAELRRS